jgi:hypothetical protein
LRAAGVGLVVARWDDLATHNEADVAGFVDDVVPNIVTVQAVAAQLTDGYLAALMRRPPLGVDLEDLTGAAVRNGTDPAEVYRRPFVTTWTALKRGASPADALAAGRARLEATAAMDIALSSRAAAREVGRADPNIAGFQRVPDGGACEFCEMAAGQRYNTDDLMPLHNRCGCTVEPIAGGREVESETIPDPAVDVREHGELGPVLVGAGDHFTDEDELT